MAATLPPFTHTPLDDIAGVTARIRSGFLSSKTRPLEFRLQQLRKLYWAIKDNQDLVLEACKKDLNKPSFETYSSEIIWCMNDIIFMQKNLAKWTQDEKPDDIPLMNKLMGPRIRKDPLGAVLVIGYA